MANYKAVKGYEGLYLVSDDGEVYALARTAYNGRGVAHRKPHVMKQGKRAGDYRFVKLSDGHGGKKLKAVHRLVAEAFLPNPDDLPEVNHIDENPANNAVSNLEWCTRQYNIEYSKGIPLSQYDLEGEKLAEYSSTATASRMAGISRRAIENAINGWSRTAGGYIWRQNKEE